MMAANQEELKQFVANRQRAYLQTFEKDSVMNKEVMEDLAKFCRGDSSTFHPDARVHALMEGRREVWLRIQDHLNMDTEILFEKLRRKGN